MPPSPPPLPEVSIVIPCLNEADTIGECVRKARGWIDRHPDVAGEIIVADNGSTDGSQDLATAAGAQVIPVAERGYGGALMGGIAAARGQFVIMGDGDDSYDFSQLSPFLEKLRAGCDLVQGCRLPRGGGTIKPGAMPALHLHVGNPLFTFLARWWFHAPLNDIYCGLRGFRRDYQLSLDQRCTGMEFATEMVIKASLRRARFGEVPITLHPDGRKAHGPHLRTFRDGWRTLRFFLLYSPNWLFLLPAAGLFLFGIAGYIIAMPGWVIDGVRFDAHTLLCASLALICGCQVSAFFYFAKVFTYTEKFAPASARFLYVFRTLTLEKGLAAGSICIVAGLVFIFLALNRWHDTGFASLDYPSTMRLVIPGATLITIGTQAVFASFLVSILGLGRKHIS